jgi:hypothetical protein
MENGRLPGGVLLEGPVKVSHRCLTMGAVDPLVGRAELEFGDLGILLDEIESAEQLLDVYPVDHSWFLFLFHLAFPPIFL